MPEKETYQEALERPPFIIEYTIGDIAPLDALQNRFPHLFAFFEKNFDIEYANVTKGYLQEMNIELVLLPKIPLVETLTHNEKVRMEVTVKFWGRISDDTYNFDLPTPRKLHMEEHGSHITEDQPLNTLAEDTATRWNGTVVKLEMNGCISIPNYMDQFNVFRYKNFDPFTKHGDGSWEKTPQYDLWDEIFVQNAEERALALLDAHIHNLDKLIPGKSSDHVS